MKKHQVILSDEQRRFLLKLVSFGQESARKLTRARILLKADQGQHGPGWADAAISQALEVSLPTIARVRKRFSQEGLEAALNHRQRLRPGPQRKLDGHGEAHLIALACSSPPEGHKRWTIRLLADKMVALDYIDALSRETVRRVLKKTNLSLG